MDNTSAVELKTFCRKSLTLLGADVSEDIDGLLSVDIPPSLLDIFDGRDSLRLAFSSELVDDGVELIVPGSYILERLLELVRQRGEVTAVSLDAIAKPSPFPVINLANAEAQLISTQLIFRNYLLVSFRISLVSDEDQDKLFQAIIDLETGEPAELDPAQIMAYASKKQLLKNQAFIDSLDKAFASAERIAMDFSKQWSASTQQKIDNRLAAEIKRLDQYYKDMLLDVAAKSKRADIRKIKKHRMKTAKSYREMERCYDIAGDLLQKADDKEALDTLIKIRTKELKKKDSKIFWSFDAAKFQEYEEEIRAFKKASEAARKILNSAAPHNTAAKIEKLRKETLEGLKIKAEMQEKSVFHPQVLEHLQDLADQLHTEKSRRISELKDKFHLKVITEPVSASLIQYPTAEYSYSAISGSLSIPFKASHDLITNQIHGPKCQSCHGEIDLGFICSCGHITCSACHNTCSGCGKDMCSMCIKTTCRICGTAVCDDCLLNCSVCGLTACKKDITNCHSCGKPVCANHSNICRICGQRTCKDCIEPSGFCISCHDLFHASVSIPAIEHIISGIPTDRVNKKNRWLIAEDKDGYILLKNGLRLHAYVVDKSSGAIKSDRIIGFIESIIIKARFKI